MIYENAQNGKLLNVFLFAHFCAVVYSFVTINTFNLISVITMLKWKVKLHSMKTKKKSGDVDPPILNLGIKLRRVVSFTS